jgi:hypothetical protein
MAFYPTLPFIILWIISIALSCIGIIFFIHSIVTKNEPWKIFSILIIIAALVISYFMISNKLEPKDMQTLLSTYITIETAVLSVIFAIIAIKQSIKRDLEKEVNNSIILTVGCLLISLIVYCISFIAKAYIKNPLAIIKIYIWPINVFNILWSISTFLIFVLIVNFMLLIVQIFEIRADV